uniref:Protein interacting with cyclin A1 n=1 Tax=Stegastes partitus TaxID=144197 RepID=A0A3B5AZ97_9TELE
MCRELRERSGAAEKEQVLKRSKRGFTYPGTLWCGAGNMADNYNQLGDFADTDSCCRTHDHCPHVIHAFSSKYGHTNFKWHSICHCDCDNTLKACLRKVNDTSSRVVGQAFFNVIGLCWFLNSPPRLCSLSSRCKRYEKLPIAVLKDSACSAQAETHKGIHNLCTGQNVVMSGHHAL